MTLTLSCFAPSLVEAVQDESSPNSRPCRPSRWPSMTCCDMPLSQGNRSAGIIGRNAFAIFAYSCGSKREFSLCSVKPQTQLSSAFQAGLYLVTELVEGRS